MAQQAEERKEVRVVGVEPKPRDAEQGDQNAGRQVARKAPVAKGRVERVQDEEKSESDHAHPTGAGVAVGSQIRLGSQSAARWQPVGSA